MEEGYGVYPTDGPPEDTTPVADQAEVLRHGVVEERGGYRILNNGNQSWLEDSKGNIVAGPVKASGQFIMYGKLDDLTDSGSGQGEKDNPLQQHTEKGDSAKKSEAEKEEEAEERLESIATKGK